MWVGIEFSVVLLREIVKDDGNDGINSETDDYFVEAMFGFLDFDLAIASREILKADDGNTYDTKDADADC